MILFHPQMKAKMSKLKEKLKNFEKVEQLNLDLQNELLKLKKHKCDNNSVVDSVTLKALEAKITPKMSEDEVSILFFSSRFLIDK